MTRTARGRACGCGRWRGKPVAWEGGGCKLEIEETWPGGVPLFHLLQQSEGMALQITCRGCGWNRSWPVFTIIAKLQETGRGIANTGCHAFCAG